MAPASGTVTAVDGLKVSVTTPSGEVKVLECLAGADIVVQAPEIEENRPKNMEKP